MVLDYCSVIIKQGFLGYKLGLRWPALCDDSYTVKSPYRCITFIWIHCYCWRMLDSDVPLAVVLTPSPTLVSSVISLCSAFHMLLCLSQSPYLSRNILTSSLVVVIKQLGLSYARTNTRKTRLLPTTCKAFTCTIERGVGQHRSTTFQSYLPFGPVTNKWKKQELGCEAKKCAFHIGINGI